MEGPSQAARKWDNANTSNSANKESMEIANHANNAEKKNKSNSVGNEAVEIVNNSNEVNEENKSANSETMEIANNADQGNDESKSWHDELMEAANNQVTADYSSGDCSTEMPSQFRLATCNTEMSSRSTFLEVVDGTTICEQNNVEISENESMREVKQALSHMREELSDIKFQVNPLQLDVLKLQRQRNRNKLLFTGKDVPQRRKGEHLMDVFTKMIEKKWSIIVEKEQITKIQRFGYSKKNIVASFNSTEKGSTFHKLLFRQPNWNGKTPLQRSMKIHIHQDMTEYDRFLQKLLVILRKEKLIAKTNVATGGWNVYKERIDDDIWRPVFSTLSIYHLINEDIINKAITEYKNLNKNKKQQEQEKQVRLIKRCLEFKQDTLPEHYNFIEIQLLSVPMSHFGNLAIQE